MASLSAARSLSRATALLRHPPLRIARPFSQSVPRPTNDGTTTTAGAGSNVGEPSGTAKQSSMENLASAFGQGQNSLLAGSLSRGRSQAINTSVLDGPTTSARDTDEAEGEYHLNVFSHKHNTHITVSKPNRDVMVSMSCGNLGFRNTQRGSYDAAYQLGAYVLDRMHQKGLHRKIQNMVVTLRGFGQGREAMTKLLLGNEGRLLRHTIRRVADGTRLKFGGTRSRKQRRLG